MENTEGIPVVALNNLDQFMGREEAIVMPDGAQPHTASTNYEVIYATFCECLHRLTRQLYQFVSHKKCMIERGFVNKAQAQKYTAIG